MKRPRKWAFSAYIRPVMNTARKLRDWMNDLPIPVAVLIYLTAMGLVQTAVVWVVWAVFNMGAPPHWGGILIP